MNVTKTNERQICTDFQKHFFEEILVKGFGMQDYKGKGATVKYIFAEAKKCQGKIGTWKNSSKERR